VEREKRKFMELAIQIAHENVIRSRGGPFGAVVVKNGEVIGSAGNEVTSLNDPTAHAEILAIRRACQRLGSFQLTDCEIYTSCEPCPMCIGAIYWARPKAVYYACTREDAARAGFDDQFIYEQLALPVEQRRIPMAKLAVENGDAPFQAWIHSTNKIRY